MLKQKNVITHNSHYINFELLPDKEFKMAWNKKRYKILKVPSMGYPLFPLFFVFILSFGLVWFGSSGIFPLQRLDDNIQIKFPTNRTPKLPEHAQRTSNNGTTDSRYEWI